MTNGEIVRTLIDGGPGTAIVKDAIYFEQGTQEWLDWRLNGITATEAAAAIGASEWATALSVYRDKLDPKPPKESEYLEWGNLLEDTIKFKKFAKMHPEFEVRQGMCYEDDWRKCSLDGELYQDGKCVAILEIKTGSSESKWDPIPAGYVAQAQWQMHVTGIKKVYFAVLINGHHYLERKLDYDEEYCKRLEAACLNLWRCITSKIPPEPDTKHADIDQEILNESTAEVEDTSTYELSDEEYATFHILKEKLAEFEEKFKAQKLLLTKYLTQARYLTYNGVRVGQMVSMKSRESVDTKLLKSKYPEIYAEVMKLGKPISYPKFG